MSSFYFCAFFFITTCLCLPLAAIQISSAESVIIGKKIFQNECSSKIERLVWWNNGENFASLGIGHFIWYPKDVNGPFEETFPQLLAFFKRNNVDLPKWLEVNAPCPWNTKDEFLAQSQEPKRKELQELLARTMPLQAIFIGMRLDNALPKILSGMNEEKRAQAKKQIAQLLNNAEGKFALIDYLNFKGDGTAASERYQGKGWGLQQVLEQMGDKSDNSLDEFINSAKFLLEQRVKGSPTERHEEKWLPGWLARVERYRKTSA